MRRRIAAVGKEVFPALAVKAHSGLIHRGELIGKLFAELRLLAEIKGGCAAAHGVHAVREREVHDRGSNACSRERAAGGAFMIVVEKVAQRVVKAVLLRRHRDRRVGFLGHRGGFRRHGRRSARRLRRCGGFGGCAAGRRIAGCCGGLLRLRRAGRHKRRALNQRQKRRGKSFHLHKLFPFLAPLGVRKYRRRTGSFGSPSGKNIIRFSAETQERL